jgi:hypothetical protein
VSITEQTSGKGPGGPPPADPKADSARRRGRFRWWWLLPPAALAVAIAVILTMLAATYQPIAYGPDSGLGGLPGLPVAKGWRWVNDFGGFTADLYVPPQQGTFPITVSIVNNGTHAVTIESVTLQKVAGTYWPLTPAGPARYWFVQPGSQQPPVHVLKNVTLDPGQTMEIAIPVRTVRCGHKASWAKLDSFLVTERFLSFRHTVALPFSQQGAHLIVNRPAPHSSGPGAVCASP